MKKIFSLSPKHALIGVALFILTTSSALFAQNIGINVSGATPSVNAILDLNTGNSNNYGLIIPNVTLGASLSTFSPPIANAPTAADVGMMIYNTGGAQAVGYYYWNGASWVAVSAGGGSVTGANDGMSLNGTNVILGSNFGSVLGKLTQNTEIPFNGNNLTFSNVGGGGNLGIDLPASTSAGQALEIGQTTNTIRVDGLATGNTFNAAPSAVTTYMMYNNASGDMYSIPAGTNGQVLSQTATGPSWQAAPVTSITGTAPIVVSPTNGAPVVSLQGTAGTVCYGTGGGSSFTLVGTAPAGTTASASSNYLQSQGAATPKWVQPVARVPIPLDAIGVAATVGKYYVGVEGGAASINFAAPTPIAGGDAAADLGAGYIATSNGTFSKVNGWLLVQTAMSVTISVYKFTPVNAQASATTLAGTLLGTTTVVASVTNDTYSFEVDGNAGTTFNKGDWIVVFSNVSVAGNLFDSGTLEVTYNVQ